MASTFKPRINDYDLMRLKQLKSNLDPFQAEEMERLLYQFKRAQIIKHRETPPGLVTMNSQVEVKNKITKEVQLYTLVFPGEDQGDDSKVSPLDEVGRSLLGHGIGETVVFPSPQGSVWLNIERVPYQPETAGDFHL